MSSALVECVPNFSEGRDRAVIEAICDAIRAAGVEVLDVDVGAATHRTVVTFVGSPAAVVEAAYAGVARAAELIDMRRHAGAHPRQGATDVCPLVPLRGVSVEECVALAHRLAERVGQSLQIPVYLYEQAATRPSRTSLADLRAGEYEALEEKLGRAEWAPDYGPTVFNARAGATVIGVRPFLVAYNVNLSTRDVGLAKQIGLGIRERGRARRDPQTGEKLRDGAGELVREPGLPACRATGWYIGEYGRAQVTVNLTDHAVTGLHTVFDRVAELAQQMGIRATGSELVGLVPCEALLAAGRHYLVRQGATPAVAEAELIHAAVLGLGLGELTPFDPQQKVVEYRVARPRPLLHARVDRFLDELGSSSPAPGGGSVAALCGALSAALSSMVAALTHGKRGLEAQRGTMCEIGEAAQRALRQLEQAIDDDTQAFQEVLTAQRLPRTTEAERVARNSAMRAAARRATEVPLAVLQACPALVDLAGCLVQQGLKSSLSDAATGAAAARAAARGAYYNVLTNLGGLRADDGPWCDQALQQATEIATRIEGAAQELDEQVLALLSGV